jgi:hypothetical protein
VNRGLVKLYFKPEKQWHLGTGLSHYLFYDDKVFTAGSASYTYVNRITDFSLEAIYEISAGHSLRNLTHLVWQTASSRGYRAHDYDRSDVMTGLFYLLQLGRNTIETGYLLTVVETAYENLHGGQDKTDDRYLDKLKLGWYYKFPNHAELNISISHQVSIGGFGGANLQYIMIF